MKYKVGDVLKYSNLITTLDFVTRVETDWFWAVDVDRPLRWPSFHTSFTFYTNIFKELDKE